MKTMIKMLTLAALCCSFSLQAATGDLVVMEITGSSTFKLVMEEVPQGLQIQLKDRSGYLLHEESVDRYGTFAKQFDLENLPDGQYNLELDYGTSLKVYALTIRKGKIFNQQSDNVEFFKPVVRHDDLKLAVTQFSPQSAELKIILYDADQNILVEDVLEGSMSLGRRYDLTQLPSGEYRIYLASEGRSYYHTLRLQQP
ncbi:MAG: hypothetical protein OER04_09260 [Cyclobacteriaceae bacterium]|nr:hypothetical protein [Cyclobacteriaceae bacterium]